MEQGAGGEVAGGQGTRNREQVDNEQEERE